MIRIAIKKCIILLLFILINLINRVILEGKRQFILINQWVYRIIDYSIGSLVGVTPIFFSLFIAQMSNSHVPFIINLQKHPEGYVFHSLEDSIPSNNKQKKARPPQFKPPQSKNTNRLIKQIGLIGEIPPIIPEQHNPHFEPVNNQEEILRQQLEAQQEQQEIDCEVKRQSFNLQNPAKWFSPKEIHSKEKEHFEEYFTGKTYKTPQLYQSYRNFMVEAYQKNAKRYLTFVSCRRVLRGDVNSLLKIYNFLLKEGVINYCLFYEGNYTFKCSSVNKDAQMSKKPQLSIKNMPEKAQIEQGEEIDTDNLTVTVINKNFSRTFRVYCSKCKLICGIVWFACNQEEDRQRNLCFDCYNGLSREQTVGYAKVDILKKMETAKDSKLVSKTSWGLDDNIKLLDFMSSNHNKSWNELSNQFQGKKSLEDIIVQFMQFPITNFDPNQYVKELKHQQIKQRQEQQVNMLQGLYQNSVYANQTNIKIQEREESVPTRKFFAFTDLVLGKLINRIKQLSKLEKVLEQTNLNINEQILCNRIRLYKTNEVPIEVDGDDVEDIDE